MNSLAIKGGKPVIARPLPPYRSLGQEELDAVTKVIESNCLSGFYGSWGQEFLGGPMVRGFEEDWCTRFNVRNSISFNSATSALVASMGAIGIKPGDEVIVPPFTMSATAMAPMAYGGIPVFVDIEPDTYCLDLDKVEQSINSNTKAIVVVNLFGHPARLKDFRDLAEERGIYLVEDNAQAPLAEESGSLAGTIGHIGVFSLNYHKHIHTGEGGMSVTADASLAQKLQLIRNHGENVVEYLDQDELSNLIGFNYRMTELSAAIGIQQLKKIDDHVTRREEIANRLSDGIKGLEGLTAPVVRQDCRHVYYVWAMKIDEKSLGVSRDLFSQALIAEGFPCSSGYMKPLYMLPLFQNKLMSDLLGRQATKSENRYEKGICPVVERINEEELIIFEPCAYSLNIKEIDLLIEAIHKVYALRKELATLERSKIDEP